MDYFIKIAIIILAIAALVALVSPLIDKVVEGMSIIAPQLYTATTAVAPYLLFARSLLNYLCGNATICGIILWFVFLAPFTEHIAILSNKIYKRITGR